jgi:hypothetical protein
MWWVTIISLVLAYPAIEMAEEWRLRRAAEKELAEMRRTQPLAADGMRQKDSGRDNSVGNMRDEFTSYSFLAVTVTGLVLLCSGLLALAFG